jgi:hypothetical protein
MISSRVVLCCVWQPLWLARRWSRLKGGESRDRLEPITSIDLTFYRSKLDKTMELTQLKSY